MLTKRLFGSNGNAAKDSGDVAMKGAMKRRMSLLTTLLSAAALLALAAFADSAKAEPPSGVTPTLLARGTYDAFKVRSGQQGPIDFELPRRPGHAFKAKSDQQGSIDFRASAKAPIDIVVRRHDYAPHSTTGWHSHPGPVFITVTLGTLTYYAYDDPSCTPHTVSAAQGFVDCGHGHVVRNRSDQPGQDVCVITAPVGGLFRTNLDAPNPYCGF